MANLNKVFLIGNLTRDPELRYTPGGTAVVDFGMAMNRRWTPSQGGEKREEVTFVDVQAWARAAEVISEYCRKGNPIFVEGRLKLDTWEGRDGQKHSRLRVVVEEFQFLGSSQGQAGNRRNAAQGAPRAPQQPSPAAQPPAAEDDVPAAAADDAPEGQFKVDDEIPF